MRVFAAVMALAASASALGRQPATPSARAEFRKALAILIEDDLGTRTAEAVALLQRAADRGDVSAKWQLADVYNSPAYQDLNDDRKSVQLKVEVAETGDPYAASVVGAAFREGIVTKRDITKAQRWLEAAARGGFATPAYQLARIAEGGQGVPRDVVEAYKWLDVATQLRARPSEPDEVAAFVKYRDTFAATLTAAELARAKDRSRAWMAARMPSDVCNPGRDRIRLAATVEGAKTAAMELWLRNLEADLSRRVIAPHCSRIESRAVMTLRVWRDGRAPIVGGRFRSTLSYFDAAVVVALRATRFEALPSSFQEAWIEVIVHAFYNEGSTQS